MKLRKFKNLKIRNVLINVTAKLLIKIDKPFIKFHRKIIRTYCKVNKKELKEIYIDGKKIKYFKKISKNNIPTDAKAEEWAKWNSWFGNNKEMTFYAYKIHDDLKKKN